MTTFNHKLNEVAYGSKDYQLSLLRQKLSIEKYPGYPDFSDRLYAGNYGQEYTMGGRLILPFGPWEINGHVNCTEANKAPKIYEELGFIGLGLEIDSRGRPLHPWLKDMIEDTAIGLVTGKGFYHKWGPNKTADPILFHRGSVLLVRRSDTGNWALPGGFVDPGETTVETSIRECREETGVIIPEDTTIEEVYDGLVVDIRITANAWPETTAYLMAINDNHELPEPRGSSENSVSAWFPVDDIKRQDILFGAHKYLVKLALEALK